VDARQGFHLLGVCVPDPVFSVSASWRVIDFFVSSSTAVTFFGFWGCFPVWGFFRGLLAAEDRGGIRRFCMEWCAFLHRSACYWGCFMALFGEWG
jgi:hypothetical protein